MSTLVSLPYLHHGSQCCCLNPWGLARSNPLLHCPRSRSPAFTCKHTHTMNRYTNISLTLLSSTAGYYCGAHKGIVWYVTPTSSSFYWTIIYLSISFELMLYILKCDGMNHRILNPDSDLLVEPGLEKHSIFEVDGVGGAAELCMITNCTDAQIQLPLRAINYRAVGFRIRLYHLHASTRIMEKMWKCLSSTRLWDKTQRPRVPYWPPAAEVLQ